MYFECAAVVLEEVLEPGQVEAANLVEQSPIQFVFSHCILFFFFFQAEDGIRDDLVTGVQTCALPIFMLLMPVIGRLVSKADSRHLIAVGLAISAIGLFSMSRFNLDVDFWTIATARLVDRKSVV